MSFLDPRTLIETFGYIGLFVIVFAESGLFFGFFLPGDSLLLTAGLFAYTGVLDERIVLPIVFVAAVLGDNVGYWFGRKAGPPLFTREKSLLFRPKNLEAARRFYDKHGGKTVILARFMPFIRTFAPIVAGAVSMNYRSFMTYNLIGAFIWGIGVTMVGYLLGSLFPPEVLDRYFLIIVLAVIFISVAPTALHLWRENGAAILAAIRRRLSGAPAPVDPVASDD
jgi:membrane-associated protein